MKLNFKVFALVSLLSMIAASEAFARYRMVIICRNADCSKYSKVYIKVKDSEPFAMREEKIENGAASVQVFHEGSPEAKQALAAAEKSK